MKLHHLLFASFAVVLASSGCGTLLPLVWRQTKASRHPNPRSLVERCTLQCCSGYFHRAPHTRTSMEIRPRLFAYGPGIFGSSTNCGYEPKCIHRKNQLRERLFLPHHGRTAQ